MVFESMESEKIVFENVDSEKMEHILLPDLHHTPALKTPLFTDDGMLEAKILAMIVLGCVAAAICFVPIGFSTYIRRRMEANKSKSKFGDGEFSFLFPFGGGVLLCTIFLHLLPEVTEDIEELYSRKILDEMKLALPELLTCCGFFMMLFVDGITHSILHRIYQTSPSPRPNSAKISTVQNTQLTPSSLKNSKWSLTDGSIGETVEINDECRFAGSTAHLTTDRVHHSNPVDCIDTESVQTNGVHHNHSHEHNSMTHFDHTIISKISLVRCFLFVLALSVHEFFEGLAIGLASKVNSVYYLLTAVASHKLVIALCIGVEIVTTRIKFSSACTYIITYSIVSPIGILVGMLVLSDANSGNDVNLIASAVLQGIATGTLLYVVFFEVLTKTMSKKKAGLFEIFSILVGFVTMLIMQYYLGDDD